MGIYVITGRPSFPLQAYNGVQHLSPVPTMLSTVPRAGLRALARAHRAPALRCSARALSASALRANEAPPQKAPADPKLVAIVDQVEKLTLLEASSLVTLLKVGALS